MARIIRVKVNWTGFVGSPGYSNFHFEPTVEGDPFTQPLVDAAATKVQTWLTANKAQMPNAVITGLDPVVTELDEVTYNIESFWNINPVAPSAGTGGVSYTAGAGYNINWGTQGVRNGRRVRGRTFVVPIAGGMYEGDGSFIATALNTWRTAATALHADSDGVRLVVHAKTPGALIPDGGAYDVISSSVNDRPAFLTSRRS